MRVGERRRAARDSDASRSGPVANGWTVEPGRAHRRLAELGRASPRPRAPDHHTATAAGGSRSASWPVGAGSGMGGHVLTLDYELG